MIHASPSFWPKVSVIINTDGRASALATCLESIRYLKYPNFEVVVVVGPTQDGSHEFCKSYKEEIVFSDCPVRNLSVSRNISIKISSGEIVAFLDDDSIPEPEWLNDVVPAFRDPQVAVAGGFLHDHTGKTYQWQFGTLNRFGEADMSWVRAAPEYNFPYSFNYPHVMANSLFRRSAIVECGGFDEEYEYFLDESDIILRFVDNGWKVAQLDKGFIHHKFMPSHIRNDSRILTSWYSVFKNKTYFSLINNGGHFGVDRVLEIIDQTSANYRAHVKSAIDDRRLPAEAMERLELEIEKGVSEGLKRGLEGRRRLVSPTSLQGRGKFVRFKTWLPGTQQRCIVWLDENSSMTRQSERKPDGLEFAEKTAAKGHQVHFLTVSGSHDTVDFENGVWVHRICPRHAEIPHGLILPQQSWNYSNTMLEEAKEIASRRAVDCVFAPGSGDEGVAFANSRQFMVVGY
jgi:GT2 family glycosyltransferase